MINELEEGQIFVFGSNIKGHHIGGAAKQAYEDFGAVWGLGSGLQGRSYAIPTMEGLANIVPYVDQFIGFARDKDDLTFLVTRVGCGIAGYTDEEIAPMFRDVPINVRLPEEWSKLL